MYVDFIAVITSIPVGLMIDKVGRRRKFIILSAFLFALTHLIFYQLPNCWAENEVDVSIVGFLLLGLSNTFYSSGLIPAVSLVVPKVSIGTAFGVLQMAESATLAALPIASGLIV